LFARIVEPTTKPGNNKLVADTIADKVRPILKKQLRP
jgi:hypothetical protein